MKLSGKLWTISNGLSFLRLLMVIPFWFLFDYFDESWARLSLILLAIVGAFTDFLDGFLARKYNQSSEFGKIMDPLADKICLGGIVIKMYLIGLITPFLFYLIIGRDLLIFISGIFLSKKIGKVLPSNMLGKIAVTVLAVYIGFVILQVERDALLFFFSYYLTISFLIISFVGYAYRAFEYLRLNSNETV